MPGRYRERSARTARQTLNWAFFELAKGLSYTLQGRPALNDKVLLIRWMGRPYDISGNGLLYFRNEHFEGADVQFFRVEVSTRTDGAGKEHMQGTTFDSRCARKIQIQ